MEMKIVLIILSLLVCILFTISIASIIVIRNRNDEIISLDSKIAAMSLKLKEIKDSGVMLKDGAPFKFIIGDKKQVVLNDIGRPNKVRNTYTAKYTFSQWDYVDKDGNLIYMIEFKNGRVSNVSTFKNVKE